LDRRLTRVFDPAKGALHQQAINRAGILKRGQAEIAGECGDDVEVGDLSKSPAWVSSHRAEAVA
jgi:hypothetical protein